MTSGRALLVGSAGIVWFVALAIAVPVPSEISVAPFDEYGDRIADGDVPYRDFSIEYPPGAIPVIAAPAVSGAYDPVFRALQTVFACAVIVAVAVLLRRGPTARLVAGVAVVASLPLLLGPVVIQRYDLWPAALVVWSLVAIEGLRIRSAAVLLGLAVAAKVWAAALIVPFLAYVSGTLQREPRRFLVLVGISAMALVLPFALVAPGGVGHSLLRQGERDVQLESVLASLLLVGDALGFGEATIEFASGSWNVTGVGISVLATVTTLAGIAAVAALSVRLWHAREQVSELRTPAAAFVALVLVFAKVLSPQFLIWLVPLVAVVPGAVGAGALALAVPACLLTQLVYPARYDELVAKDALPIGMLALRNVLLVVTAGLLARAVWSSVRPRVLAATGRSRLAG